jgi:hypothetical protein
MVIESYRGRGKSNAGSLLRCFGQLSLLSAAIVLLLAGSARGQSSAPDATIPPTYFGMHIHHPAPATWPSVPIGAWRFWDAHAAWPDMESKRGQWDFSYIDKYLSLAEEHHAEVLFALGLTPRWASARPDEKSAYQPGWAAGPADLQDWRAYVSTVVAHCGGRVHVYEIWNEPNYRPFWTGTTDEMVTLTMEASKIIRSIDPHATIVSPAATNNATGPKWLAEFLAKGGGQYVDVIGYHFYVNTQPPESMLPSIQQVRQVMAENRQSKPLWNTETGWLPPSKFESDELAAAYVARSYILAWSGGVQRFYWYAWDQSAPLPLIDKDTHALKPAGKAFGVIQSWLVGARMGECKPGTDHTWTCELVRNRANQYIVWNPDGPKKFSPPSQWHARTITPLLGEPYAVKGNTIDIGPSPVLLDSTAPN